MLSHNLYEAPTRESGATGVEMTTNIEKLLRENIDRPVRDVLESLLEIKNDRDAYLTNFKNWFLDKQGIPGERYTEVGYGFMRTSQRIPIHVSHFRSVDEFGKYLNGIIAAADQAIDKVLNMKDPIFLQLFLANISRVEYDSLTVRLQQAIKFAELVNNETVLENTNEFIKRHISMLDMRLNKPNPNESFFYRFETHGRPLNDIKLVEACFRAVANYVDLGMPVIISGLLMSTKEALTWDNVRKALRRFLVFNELDWLKIYNNLNQPTMACEKSSREGTKFILFLENEHDAALYLSFIRSVIPSAAALRHARAEKQPNGKATLLLSQRQLDEFIAELRKINAQLVLRGEGQFVEPTKEEQSFDTRQAKWQLLYFKTMEEACRGLNYLRQPAFKFQEELRAANIQATKDGFRLCLTEKQAACYKSKGQSLVSPQAAPEVVLSPVVAPASTAPLVTHFKEDKRLEVFSKFTQRFQLCNFVLNLPALKNFYENFFQCHDTTELKKNLNESKLKLDASCIQLMEAIFQIYNAKSLQECQALKNFFPEELPVPQTEDDMRIIQSKLLRDLVEEINAVSAQISSSLTPLKKF